MPWCSMKAEPCSKTLRRPRRARASPRALPTALLKPRSRRPTRNKPKAKPESLKHGGNGGKNRRKRRNSEGISGRSKCIAIHEDIESAGTYFLKFSVSSDFFLRSLRVSGFLVLLLVLISRRTCPTDTAICPGLPNSQEL